MSDAIGTHWEVSGHEYRCHVHWSVCSYIMRVCGLALMVELRPISFYSTMTERWRNIERHWVEILDTQGCKNPHFVSLFRRQMGKKKKKKSGIGFGSFID